MHWLEVDTTDCSIAAACDVIGDRWSLLIAREIINGVRRYDDLVDHLGISPSVLAARLHHLVDRGVLQRKEYREPGQRTRQEYLLTPAGRDLQPILIAFMQWGDRHLVPDDRHLVTLTDRRTGGPIELRLVDENGRTVGSGDVAVNVDPAHRR